MESIATPPIIDLDGENDADDIALAKSLGYFYIPRSSSYGEIPDRRSLTLLVEELFDLSLETKLSLGPNYVRSISLNEPPSKSESISFTSANKVINTSKSVLIKILFNLCQQFSVHLADLLDLPSNSSSTASSTILFDHYSNSREPLIPNKYDDSLLQFHLFSNCHLQRLDPVEHEWKVAHPALDLDEYILVSLPNFLYRYSIDEYSYYTIKYLCYNFNSDQMQSKRYFFNLKQNISLRYFTFTYLYIMQGVPAGFSSTALANYLTAEGENSSTVGTFVSLAGLPWALQFVWGPLIDRFQSSHMGRRRPWVIASQMCAFLASLGLLSVGNPPSQFIKTLVIAFFIHSVFASIQDASVDAQAITCIPINERGRINGFMRGGFLVGQALGAAGLSWILRKSGYKAAALINSMVLFIFTIITFFIKEKPNDSLCPCTNEKVNSKKRKQLHNYSICKLFFELFKGLLAPQSLRLFLPILLVYTSQAAFIRAYNVHLIKVLHWEDTSVSITSGAWGTLIVIGVALIGGWLADRIGARRLLIIVIFIHAGYMLTVNLLEPYWHQRPVATVVLILWSMMDPILSTAAMPVLMSLCRQHVEGSQFTTYMSMVNLCDLSGAFLSGQLQRFIPANVIGLGCSFIIVCSLVIASVSVWYERRQTSTNAEKMTTADSLSLQTCWPIRVLTKYHRGSFKIIV